jgi:hypothetical protein
VAALCIAALFGASGPAEAQRAYEPLFDRFNLRLEGSWVAMSTNIRLDSEALGTGTELNFEDDLDLGSSKVIPTLAFEWQVGRRHKLGVRWQDISRGSTTQALTEIQWGDEIIPVDADIVLGFDIEQFFIDYAYFPWVGERWAAGFGLGIRWMEMKASLAWSSVAIAGEGSTDADGSGPLPYLYFEYRRLLSENWRLKGGFGWLSVKIGDIDGRQLVGRVDIEYLAGRHWGFGVAGNLANVDVDWDAVQTDEGDGVLNAVIGMDISDVSVFVRFRF